MKSYRTVMICFLLEIMWKDYFDIICMKGAKERLFRTDFFWWFKINTLSLQNISE